MRVHRPCILPYLPGPGLRHWLHELPALTINMLAEALMQRSQCRRGGHSGGGKAAEVSSVRSASKLRTFRNAHKTHAPAKATGPGPDGDNMYQAGSAKAQWASRHCASCIYVVRRCTPSLHVVQPSWPGQTWPSEFTPQTAVEAAYIASSSRSGRFC